MARRARSVPVRWISAALVGGLWWWAVCRLALWPGSAGPVEGAVAAGGWGLSLLPVHCVPWTGRREAGGRTGWGGPVAAVEARISGVWRVCRGSRAGRLAEAWWQRVGGGDGGRG
ncbi:hypothetical protein ACFC0M_31760 [Streptomyces sp. NPDC056149]|uniref:hypothetical protein n=1 Tax=Streptomyces sp. NPDC056149 TaxID=3345728 RepID=UPI0035E1A26F